MQSTQKIGLLLGLTVVATVAVFLLRPIPQSLSFHHFADIRPWLGIPNFGNVASNLPFVFVGFAGLSLTWKAPVAGSIRLIYTMLFIGVVLTGLGSAWYHSNPNNDTLVWDRIPMTIVFMSLFSATVAELISLKQGTRLLIPLVLIGIASVWWWHYSEGQGHGDLRLYYLVQYYPMLFIPLILWFFYDPAHKPTLKCLIWVVIWYVIAKLFEQLDQPIYAALGISGHTLKHLAAAVSTWYFVLMFRQKYTGNRSKLPRHPSPHMLSSLLLAGALSVSIHLSGQSDTLPRGDAPAFGTEGERQAHELQQLFRDHYTPQTYPLFEGAITWMALGSYRFGSFFMRMDSLPDGMMGLLSRGLLYPGLLGPVFSSIDTLSIGNIGELKGLSPSPQTRRFSCWVSNGRMANPTSYVFELTNRHGTTDMDMASFIRDARLTFLYQVSIII